MIAMQYSFILPANYEMGIIDQRIASNGHKFDHYPGLLLKAFQSSRKAAGQVSENRYAPFYVWESPEAMQHFLLSEGFAAVCEAFGRPAIDIWPIAKLSQTGPLTEARYASREILPVSGHVPLAEAWRPATGQDGALAVVTALDPQQWRQLRYTLWRDQPDRAESDSIKLYKIGHMALP